MNTTEFFRLGFPSQTVIEAHLKKHPATTYLHTEEKIISAVAGHFANKQIIYPEVRLRIAACLTGEEELDAICKLDGSLKPQEKIGQVIVNNIASALFDCAEIPVWRSRL